MHKFQTAKTQKADQHEDDKTDKYPAHQPNNNNLIAWAKPRQGMDDLDDLLDCEQDLFEEIPADQGIHVASSYAC